MKGALIHGVLLAVMLVYGYRTWTRDKTEKPKIGDVVLWDKSEADLVAVEWKTETRTVRVERRDNAYWWGQDTSITKRPKPPEPPKPADAGSGSAGSAAAGSGSGSGSAAEPPKPPEMIEDKKVREFPLSDKGEKLIKTYLGARALRDLGKPDDQAKKDYKLADAKTTLTVEMKDGKHTFLVGGQVYGGQDRYVLDQDSGKAYVFAKDLIGDLEGGFSTLQLTDVRGFDVNKIASVTIESGGKSKTVVRVTAGEEGKQVKTWGDPQTKKPNTTVGNFIDNAGSLRPVEYSAALKADSTPPLLSLTYKDERGALLGTITLYKHEKPGKLAPGAELDPANPPKGEVEYYVITPRTRVAAIVRKDNAERIEQDIATAFSDNPVDSVDPKGNPFKNPPPGSIPTGPGAGGAPGIPAHGGMPGAPGMHGAPAPTGAAPTGAAKPAAPAVAPTGASPAGATKPAAPGTAAPTGAAPTGAAPTGAMKPAPPTGAAKPAAPAAAPAPKPAAPAPAAAAPAPATP
jgi:hypothetical protein